MRRLRNGNARKERLHPLPPLTDKTAFELTATEFGYLLSDLCVAMGFCISDPASRCLWESKPATVDAFVDGLFAAEGLPSTRGRLRSAVKLRVQEFIAARRAP